MKRRSLYTYNPATDAYERVYPTLGSRVRHVLKCIAWGAAVWGVVFLIAFLFYGFGNKTYIEKENGELKQQYVVMQKRLSKALSVMEDIRARDDNFYRVMMQMEPVKMSQRYAGLGQSSDLTSLSRLSDARLLSELDMNMNLLERQLYAQSRSFDELRSEAFSQREKISHIPGIMPINVTDYTVSSGYGMRKDPVYGTTAFHAGLDFAAPSGTPVYATADGVVKAAERAGGYGNKIDIDHGFNYLTRYGHLSKIDVVPGQRVMRGDKIGEVGSTGKSTGPHLHYEVRFKDEPQNPVNYYFFDVTPAEYQAMINAAENAGHVMD
ncbi:MAG: M23 family metallopeptidase [Bacteroidales bacterium]|nr:M23 family metallopeptidase [Bacteroidales bacterium]